MAVTVQGIEVIYLGHLVLNGDRQVGLNRKAGLKILEDDKSFFPDYNGAFLVREDVLEKYPELEGILNQLAGEIPTEQMAELTYQVDVLGRAVDDVAREFLVSQGTSGNGT